MYPPMIVLVLGVVVVAVCNGAALVKTEEDEIRPTEKTEEDQYGYQNGDVTHGLGYGHHLHPFYYQGKMVKFYDCAKGDDWRPFATEDQQEKKRKLAPVKKYDPNAEKTKKHSYAPKQIQSRRDTKVSRRKLEQDHAKLLMDINAMSDDRPLRYRGKLLMDAEASFDQPIRAAESEDMLLLDDLTYSKKHNYNKKVNDAKTDHRFKNMLFNGVPFQRYKKFKVITVKPSPTVLYKYVKVPLKSEHKMSFGESNVKPEGHPYPFVNAVNTQHNTRDPLPPFRKGRQVPSNVIVPQLTMLEQFLLLFPKLI